MTCRRCTARECAKSGRFAGKLCARCIRTLTITAYHETARRKGRVAVPWLTRHRRNMTI